jgi:hypothetical protein
MKFWIGHWINTKNNTKDKTCSSNIDDVHVTNMTLQIQKHSKFSRKDLYVNHEFHTNCWFGMEIQGSHVEYY